jgi:biofilm protein TabA
MIAGKLKHVEEQTQGTPNLKKAFQFLKNTSLGQLPEGRVEIDGTQVYALVQYYETLPLESAKIEAHQKYIDLQYIQEGEEVIGWVPLERLGEQTAYNEAKDVFYGKVPADMLTRVQLSAGELAVLYPADAHAPKIAVNGPSPVKKIVVKVAI